MASLPDLFGIPAKDIQKLSPAKQRELRDLLRKARKIGERNPLEAWFPHDKQKDFLGARVRTRAFYAGNRTGKSECGCALDLIQCLPPELVPERLHPYKHFGWEEPAKGRVITPDLGHTMEAILSKFRSMTPREGLATGMWEGSFRERDRILKFKNGSSIDFMSFEQKPDKFGGVDLHFTHFDEEPNGPNSYKIWRDSRARLIDHGGWEIFTMTPLHGEAWVSEHLWERRGASNLQIVQARMGDNPYLDPKEIEEFAATLTEEERKVVIDGEPVGFEGKFFPEFNVTDHVRRAKSPHDIQGFEAHVLGVDPSLTRTGVVWIAFDEQNNAFVYDEFVAPEKAHPEQIVAEIRARNRFWGVTPDYAVIDPAARAGSTVNREAVEDVYRRAGLDTLRGDNKRGPGIWEVKRRLQHGGLHISEDCRTLQWEIKRYRRDLKSSDEYAAVKENDDLTDAMRYVVMSRPWAVAEMPKADAEWNPTSGTAPPASVLHAPASAPFSLT